MSMVHPLESIFQKLPARSQALVAYAVLLDGFEAGIFLENDSKNGLELRAAAETLAGQTPELRLPLVATLLRNAVEELK